MKIKFLWTIAIISWVLFLTHIFLPFTGLVEREWGGMTVWAILSMIWAFNLLEARIEKKNKDKEKNV